MANIASIKVFFEGTHKTLKEVKNLIVKTDNFGQEEIDFSYIAPFVPKLDDKQIYELFGCNWDEYVLNKYSSEEKSQFDQKVNNFIQSQGWIGMRDLYINKSFNDVTTEYTDNFCTTLIIKANFRWSAPTLFFAKVAQDFGLTFKALEFVEGNNTFVSFIDENGKCRDIKNSSKSIVESDVFRDYAVQMGLHRPSHLLAVAMFMEKTQLSHELVKKYQISAEDFSSVLAEMKEEFQDPWQSGAFFDLNVEKLENMSVTTMMDNFVSLKNEVEKINRPKIK